MSTFGSLLRVSTFGESHGDSVGCIVDGLPANLRVCPRCIQLQLHRRRPGAASAASSSSRNEQDNAEILSGVENGRTLGSPVCIVIKNKDTKKEDYSNVRAASQGMPRPGHAELTYLLKYRNVSTSGGGRSSARETAARVAAAALIESSLLHPLFSCRVVAFVSSVGAHTIPEEELNKYKLYPPDREQVDRDGKVLFDPSRNVFIDAEGVEHEGVQTDALHSLIQRYIGPISKDKGPVGARDYLCEYLERMSTENEKPWEIHTRCPHPQTAVQIARTLLQVRADGDSIGGCVSCTISNPPAGLGEPVFDRLPAKLAQAMLSIPATKGFEIGRGFDATRMRGSEHNDVIHPKTAGASFSTSPESFEVKRKQCFCTEENINGQTETSSVMTEEEVHEAAIRACAQAATKLKTLTNSAGGTLGGISTGENINIRVAFKPPSSISKTQVTSDYEGNIRPLQIQGRHDPCVVARAVPVVEAMAVLAISDLLMQHTSRAGLQF